MYIIETSLLLLYEGRKEIGPQMNPTIPDHTGFDMAGQRRIVGSSQRDSIAGLLYANIIPLFCSQI